MSRPKQIRIEPIGGEPFLLDEATTQEIYEMADEEGEDPEVFLKTTLRMHHLLMRHGLMKKFL